MKFEPYDDDGNLLVAVTVTILALMLALFAVLA
jgi:hypothetical protein